MSKIRRNVFYYTDHSKQNHWCDRCYNDLKEETAIQLDDGKETKKSHLLRLKNDAMPEEQWVQCDDCNEWNHQVCALFNATRRNSSKTFSCPKCVLAKSKGDQFAKKDSPVSTYKDASALPECKMSRAIEEGLSQALSEEYERLANERGCNLAEVEKADGLCVRVVMSLEKKHKVREGVSLCSVHDIHLY
jgi:E1A/CREB-binding protein